MNVLLIQPPVRDYYQTAVRTEPLGLAYLAAALRRQGHRAAILDCQVPGLKQRIAAPEAFRFIESHYPPNDLSPFALYRRFQHFGLPWSAISVHIQNQRPDAVGISCQFTPYAGEALAVASLVKEIDAGIPVIMGGAHASAAPAHLLQNPLVDYVVIGEGETVLCGLVNHLAAGQSLRHQPGIGYRAGGTVHINPRAPFIADLDQLPLPARDLLPRDTYRCNGVPYTMLLTSRGCPQGCSYCSVASVMGATFRARTTEQIIAEMVECRDRFGITLFDIEDDNFTLDRRRALNLLSAVADTFGADVQLLAMNGLSLLSLDPELLGAMRAAGFRHLDLALGSASPAVCRRVNRPHDLRHGTAVLQQAFAAGFPVTTYIILGIPGQQLAEMLDSIVHLAHQPTMIGPSVFYPSPGTAVFRELYPDPGPVLDQAPLLRSSLFPVTTDDFSRLDLITLLRLVRWINFIKLHLADTGLSETALSTLRREAATWLPADLAGGLPDKPAVITLPALIEHRAAGRILSALFLQHNRFFGLRRIRRALKNLYTYEFFPYNTSATVIEHFERQGPERIAAAVSKTAARRPSRSKAPCT